MTHAVSALDVIRPDWPAPPGIGALCTTREGGVSAAPFDRLNVGTHVGDAPEAVAENRRRVRALVPAEPRWLEQVHGIDVLDADASPPTAAPPRADGAVSRRAGVVLAIMTADCLPILFAARDGSVVGAAHAGWRGLAGGVIEATVRRMGVPPASVLAWLGPAIGAAAYEVGEDVREAFVGIAPTDAGAFRPRGGGKFDCDLEALARARLARLGVSAVHGGGRCTARESDAFFSFRRDGRTGRMAALVWKADA